MTPKDLFWYWIIIFVKKCHYSGISYTSEITYDCMCECECYLTDDDKIVENREIEIAHKKNHV